jgi:hypothetical protein
MKNIELKIKNLALEITVLLWPFIEKQSIDCEIKYDDINSGLSLEHKILKRLTIKVIDEENERARYNNNVIKCGSKGGLAHELVHLIFDKKNIHIKLNSKPLIDYIGGFFTSPSKAKITEYINHYAKNDYDRIIGYLYLADEEELIAKATGFCVAKKDNDNSDEYISSVLKIYDDMSKFRNSDNSIANNTQIDEIVKESLAIAGAININDIEKFINSQGKKFKEVLEL